MTLPTTTVDDSFASDGPPSVSAPPSDFIPQAPTRKGRGFYSPSNSVLSPSHGRPVRQYPPKKHPQPRAYSSRSPTPYKPHTTTVVARRMIDHALGVKRNLTEKERQEDKEFEEMRASFQEATI